MKRLFEKPHNPKRQKALKIIGYTALGLAIALLAGFIVALSVLTSTGFITFNS